MTDLLYFLFGLLSGFVLAILGFAFIIWRIYRKQTEQIQ